MEELFNRFDTYLQGSLLLALAISYLAGLLASLTPCVYPMVPIAAGVVAGSNLGGSRARGFLLSLSYITGLALMYAALGVFAAASGRFFGTVNTSPWVFLLVGNLLLLLALVLFDVISLPNFAPRWQGGRGGLAGVFAAGMASALVAGPCTAPVLGGVLAYVAASGDLLRGGLLLFIFALGMGSLLLLVGTFSGLLAALPRSGPWLTRVRTGLGLAMLLAAQYFLIKAGTLFI